MPSPLKRQGRREFGMNREVTVLGAGVSGLSSALVLAQAGRRVRIIAEHPPEQTTSAVAAACWYPFSVGQYDYQWARDTHAHFLRLLDDPDAGVRLTESKEYFVDRITDEKIKNDFWWRNLPEVEFIRLKSSDLPAGYIDGVRFFVPVIHMPTYLAYLQHQLNQLGVIVHLQHIRRFEDVDASLLINCTALGSIDLCGDRALYPARGQVIVVETNGLKEMIFATGGSDLLTYIIPRGTDIVLGGTYAEGQWDTTPDETISNQIRLRCERLIPSLSGAPLLASKVGLRPCRHGGPRLEIERRSPQTILHNYGHGGSGVTLSWGCAEQILKLLQ